MSDAHISELRCALADFLGKKQFSKFVAQGLQNGRFRYWQEEAWQRFALTHPEYAVVSTDTIEAAIRICYVHGCDLKPDLVGVIRHELDYTEE